MRVNFHRRIYRRKAIESTIAAFRHLADFSFSREGDYFRVRIGNIDAEVKEELKEELKDEFCNFVLAETQYANRLS